MDNINKLLYQMLSVTLFSIAVYFLTNMASSYNKVIKDAKETLSDDYVYQQVISDENIVSYGELIASLCLELEYDVRVNETVIYKNSHDIGNIEKYNIEETNYKRMYTYKDDGSILGIIYTSIP